MKALCIIISGLLPATTFAQPSITSFSPLSANAGASVTINGSGFSTTPANNIVHFGTIRAVVSSASPNSLIVQVPPSAAYNKIFVSVGGLVAASPRFFTMSFPGGGPLTPESFFYSGRADSVENMESNDFAIADMDGDGKNDIAVIDRLDDSVSLYRNTTTGQAVSFAPKIDLRVGTDPNDIGMGDLDGDMKPDLVVANRFGHTLSIFRNTSTAGTISFASRIDIPTSNFPGPIIIADLDGDGKNEVAIGTFGTPGVVAIHRNTSSAGTISFAARIDIAIGGVGNDLRAADMDGDGKQDLIFCDFINPAVSVIRNTSTPGNISFASRVNFLTGNFPTSLEVGDIDGDGKHDVAVAEFDGNYLSVLRNTSNPGSITFASRIDIPDNSGPVSVSFGDLNGDGKSDMAALTDDDVNNARAISVFISTSSPGSISFEPKVDYSAIGYERIMVTEIDADGKSDIAICGSLFRALIFRNRVGEPGIASFFPTAAGPGTTITITGTNFNGVTSVSFGGVPASSFSVVNSTTITAVVGSGATGAVAVTNLSGTASMDGFLFTTDPLFTGFTPSIGGTGTQVTIYGANLSGALNVRFGGVPAASFTVVSPSVITAVVGAGATGNVEVQLAASTLQLPGFFFSTGIVISGFSPLSGAAGSTVTITGANFSPVPSNNIVYFGQHRATVTAASVNSLSVVVPSSASYKPITVTVNERTAYSRLPFVMTFTGTPSLNPNSFSPRIDLSVGNPSYNATLCDWDGDGKLDIAATAFDQHRVSLFRNTSNPGNASFAARIDSTTGNNPRDVSGDDLDGDGKKDLSVTGFPLNVFKNNGSPGILSFQPRLGFPIGGISQDMFVGELTADGKPDIAVANTLNIAVIRNTTAAGAITFDNAMDFATGAQPQAVCIADLNEDGKDDVIAVNAASHTLSILKNTGTGNALSFDAPVNYPTGSKPWHVATGDLNGDGKLDIIVTNFESHTISVFRNTGAGAGISFAPKSDISTGNEPRHVALADINGDGKVDVVVVNAMSNSVSIFRNTTNSAAISFAARIDYGTGTFPQSVTLDDMDSDGKPDILVSNYIGNSVSVLRNKVNEPVTSITSFTPTTAGPGATVTITGTNFTGATAVSFGNVAASSFTVVSATTITAVVASGASGSVTVTAPAGVASLAGFTYLVPPPTITSFTPTSGSNGTVVTLTGTNFYSPMNVTFGGTSAPVTINSTTSATATVLNGSTGLVGVHTGGGSAFSTTQFTYIPQPQILFFNPTSGTTGSVITIDGVNFTNVTSVQFGGVPASSFNIVSSNQITAVVGAGASGNVSVHSPGGSHSIGTFTYNVVTGIGNPGPANSPDLVISPNPSDDLIRIGHPAAARASIRFFDMAGREIKMIITDRNSRETWTSVKYFVKGIYKVTWSDGTRILKRTFMVR